MCRLSEKDFIIANASEESRRNVLLRVQLVSQNTIMLLVVIINY